MVVLVLVLGIVGIGKPAFAYATDVKTEADWILSLQVTSGPDSGLIQTGIGQTIMIPYFSSMAASGLADATRATGDSKYVTAAWAWLHWYASHMNSIGFVTNYSFSNGAWSSTGTEDSTDGYAGAFLKAVKEAYDVSGDQTQLSSLWPAVGKAVSAMLATSDGDFMTYAKPDYPQLFLMDNVEVYEGFRAVEYLAGTPHPDPVLRRSAVTWAAGMANRFEIFWDANANGYDVAIGSDGIRYLVDWKTLYPAVTAQAWILRTGLVPTARAQALGTQINSTFPAWDSSGSQPGQSWWPEIVDAMRYAGNSARAESGLTTMTSGIVSSNHAWPYHVGNAGLIIEQLIGAPETVVVKGPGDFLKPGSVSINVTGVPSITTGGVVSYECSLDSAPFSACTQPMSISSTSVGVHTLISRSVDSTLATDPDPVSMSWTIDSTPPTPSFTSVPAEPGNALPTFGFTATDDYSPMGLITFQCETDGGAFSPCTSPATLPITGTGTHTMELEAIDAAGNVSAPLTYSWFADATPPTTTLLSGPFGTVGTTTAQFTFTGSDDYSGVSFQCRLGLASSFAPCTSPVSYSVSGGTWAFQVRAVDGVGNPDPNPPTRVWNVDQTPPTTIIVSNPAPFSNTRDASFSFSATDDVDSGITFQCSLDGAAFSACLTPITYHGIAEGSHELIVRAKDVIGFVDPTPPKFDWIVDLTPPSGIIATPQDSLLANFPPVMSDLIQGSATDDRSGVGSVLVQLTQYPSVKPAYSETFADLSCSDASQLRCTWSVRPNVKAGRYHVTVVITDRAGNITQPPPQTDVEIAIP
ncbi:MAG: glucosidase family protein [Actinomycetota bacterium]